MEREYWVYIMANNNKVIYVGVTDDLFSRVYQHKTKFNPKSFTSRYKLFKFVHFESTNDIGNAIKREKELKKWYRKWKVELIEEENPEWEDLAEGWY